MSKFIGRTDFVKGLEDVVVCESKIGYVDGEKGWLVYRGYEIADLVKYSSFEEVSYLMLFGRLPGKQELVDFKGRLSQHRALPAEVYGILDSLPQGGNAMASLRTAFSALASWEHEADNFDLERWTDIGIRQISQMSSVVAAVARRRKALPYVAPDRSLDHTANMLWMMLGKPPESDIVHAMDMAMILHIDHEMNASTFTSMAVASSLADMYSAVTAGIASLKGPLHGGANEAVVKMLLEIGSPDRVDAYMDEAFRKKTRISGFGHRVYKAYDPRAIILKKLANEITAKYGTRDLYETALRVEDRVVRQYGGKGIFPNVDFFSGIIYYSLGIEPAMFTPIFAAGRVPGWVARTLEYLQDNRLLRPRAIYTGDLEARYIPLEERQ